MRLALTMLLVLAGLTFPAAACPVPVFRYALERWSPDLYTAVVLHRGKLAAADQAVLDELAKAAAGIDPPANFEVRDVDLDKPQEPWVAELARQLSPPSLPWLAVLYPLRASPDDPESPPKPQVMWSGSPGQAAAAQLIDSPKRRELSRRLGGGDSIVWILLECGDRAKDDAAAKLLSAELKRLEATLKLPLADPTELEAQASSRPAEPGDDAAQAAPAKPLKIAFSVLRLSRTDPAERAFVTMLTQRDARLAKAADAPAAFAAFGRGRVLDALVADEIAPAVIEDICTFLTGECSCQVKELNPGADLLLAADWEAMLDGNFAIDRPLPPLTGVLPGGETRWAQPGASAPAAAKTPPGGALVRSSVLVVGMVCVLAAVASAAYWRRLRRQRGDQP